MERYEHWAESLETGDRVFATIRHATDGKQNRHNVLCIVISVHPHLVYGNEGYGNAKLYDTETRQEIELDFCELKEHVVSPNNICYKDNITVCDCKGLCRNSC